MKKFFPLMALLFLFQVPPAAAGGLLVVQSLPIKPYNEALQGFRSVCREKAQKLSSAELKEGEIAKRVEKMKPDLILAIGMDALAKVRETRNVPIVYLMVLSPQSLIADEKNITGVSLNIAPERQLATLRQILPHVRKIGILFDPDKSAIFVANARRATAALGIELLAKGVHTPRDAVAAIEGMKGKIDALWMLPDTTVVKPETVDLLLLAAIDNRIPVLTFSDKYVEKGALLSLEVDAVDAGRQAGEMANRVLAGEDVKSVEKADARGGIVTVNLIVAKKLGITVNSAMIKQARVIR